MLTWMLACDFSAPQGAPLTEDTGEVVLVAGDTPDTGAPQIDPQTTDDDGDGYSEEEGDCDDGAATVYPGAGDGCGGGDEDCDGDIDEDAWSEDDYEPNDTSPSPMGSINSDTVQAIQAALHNDADIDRYTFSFDDSIWSWSFVLSVTLSSIPEGAEYQLQVEHLDSGEVIFVGSGEDSLAMEITEDLWNDQGGDYEVVVSAVSGADCARRYLLTLELSE